MFTISYAIRGVTPSTGNINLDLIANPIKNPLVTHWYFQRAQKKKAELTNHYRFRDLRHTFASHFVMNGGSLYDLQKLLGHARFEETQRYAHLTPEHLAKTVNIVSFGGTPPPAPSEIPAPAAKQEENLIASANKTPVLRLVGPA